MMIEGAPRYYIFLDNFYLKKPLVLKIPLGMIFDSRNSKIALKPTGIEL